VPVPSVKLRRKDLKENFLEDSLGTVNLKRKLSLNAGHRMLKQSSLPALSVKSLATGLLSVLCGLRLSSKIKSWISSRQDMILQNGNLVETVQMVNTYPSLRIVIPL
jgi:hypothetical protein